MLPDVWLDPGHWFDGTADPPSSLFAAVAAFFVVAFVASVLLYVRRRRIFAGDPVMIGLTVRLAPWLIGIAVVGLLFVASRYGQVPYLSARFLWVLCALAIFGILGYAVWFRQTQHQKRLDAFHEAQVRQRYIPRPGSARRRSRRR